MHTNKVAFLSLAGLGVIVGLGVVSGLDLEKASTERTAPRAVVRQAVGGGKWESRHEAGARRDWHIQIKQHDDGSVAGRVTIVGSPRLHQARIEGQISGSDVYGVLVDDNDRQIGTFTGAFFQRGASGTYTTADGDVGDWRTEELGD